MSAIINNKTNVIYLVVYSALVALVKTNCLLCWITSLIKPAKSKQIVIK